MTTSKTYTWTTAKGAKINLTICIDHKTSKTVYADGFDVEVPCNNWYYTVESITVNGSTTNCKYLTELRGQSCIMIDRLEKGNVYVAIPSDVEEDIYRDERQAEQKKTQNERIEELKQLIAKAERQADIPTKSEADKRVKEWINANNEGGEGWHPQIISREEYENAKKELKELGL